MIQVRIVLSSRKSEFEGPSDRLGLGIRVPKRAHSNSACVVEGLMLTILAPKFSCSQEPQVHWALEQLGTRKLLKSHPNLMNITS